VHFCFFETTREKKKKKKKEKKDKKVRDPETTVHMKLVAGLFAAACAAKITYFKDSDCKVESVCILKSFFF
jgi:hypothetical protein